MYIVQTINNFLRKVSTQTLQINIIYKGSHNKGVGIYDNYINKKIEN